MPSLFSGTAGDTCCGSKVTRRPTAEWLAQQITEAFPWVSAPTYLVRDNDRAYGLEFFPVPDQSHGYPRQANFPELTLAKMGLRNV